MALAWSFLTGFNTPITYAYFLYLIALLAHRQQRDDEACGKKQVPFAVSYSRSNVYFRYGNDWKKYMGLVPYRIIPYVY